MTVTPADRGPQVSGVASFFLALSTVAIVLRCYCRAAVVKSFGLDDWFAIIAWVFFVFFCAFAITGVYHGTGQHADVIPLEEIPVGLKWWWACEPVYVLSNMALKFSIGVFLLRIAVARTHRIIIWITVIVTETYSTAFFFIFVLQCRPSNYFWTQYTGGKGTCIDPNTTVIATYVYSGISCAADWILGIIPVFLVWKLQMNPRTKVSVALILGLGSIASSATIIRIPYVRDLANQADFLYATTDVAIWSTCETGIGIAASSFATLKPLFRTFFSRSKLMGGTSTQDRSSPWPLSTGIRQGYVRSGSDGIQAEYVLRPDSKNQSKIETVIEGATELREARVEGGRHRRRSRSMPRGWNNSESGLTEVSSEEEEVSWNSGIRKTTISQQVSYR